MPSPFVKHHIRSLFPSFSSQSFKSKKTSVSTVNHERLDFLRTLLASLQNKHQNTVVREAIASLSQTGISSLADTQDLEEYTLKRTIIGVLVVDLYSEALDIFLNESSQAESEAEWWAEVERSRQNVALYLLQTTPTRLLNLAQTILQALRTHNIPLTPSLFNPAALRRLFPSTDALRPNALTISLFPHLRNEPHIISFGSTSAKASISHCYQILLSFLTLPFDLTRQEAHFKRRELEKIRDERAEILGSLAGMRDALESALHEEGGRADASLEGFVVCLDRLVAGTTNTNTLADTTTTTTTNSKTKSKTSTTPPPPDVLAILNILSSHTLPTHLSQHTSHLTLSNLLRPSRFTLLWPRIFILPPLTFYVLKNVYAQRADWMQLGREAVETVQGFVKGWLVEPLRGVLKTIRAGGEEGMLVRKEGVVAEFQSLERMVRSLAEDKLSYSPAQLDVLSQQVRVGDLTPVLQLYEQDIKKPFTSAVTGTLLRGLFIQIQKAKVDIDQALAGIDKLLKSQELTFAFVGVAPALSILYLFAGYTRSAWNGGRGKGRYGGRKKRAGAWSVVRRIERLLIYQPKSKSTRSQGQDQNHANGSGNGGIPPLTAGLLLLSLTRLRRYAEECLPAHSGLRRGFLEDVGDLEEPSLGRAEKLRVVERMWRSWGGVLGWGEGV